MVVVSASLRVLVAQPASSSTDSATRMLGRRRMVVLPNGYPAILPQAGGHHLRADQSRRLATKRALRVAAGLPSSPGTRQATSMRARPRVVSVLKKVAQLAFPASRASLRKSCHSGDR